MKWNAVSVLVGVFLVVLFAAQVQAERKSLDAFCDGYHQKAKTFTERPSYFVEKKYAYCGSKKKKEFKCCQDSHGHYWDFMGNSCYVTYYCDHHSPMSDFRH